MTNPYAPPSPAADAPSGPLARDPALAGARRSEAPRWLAVLVALFAGQQLLGAGYLILGQRRKAVVWLLVGLGFLTAIVVAVRVNAPSLLLVALPCLFLAWIGSLIGTGLVKPGQRLSTARAVAIGAAVVVLALVWGGVQRHFLMEAFQMPAGSMMPTLLVGDHFFVAKGTRAEPGEVIVFKYPADPDVDYVKRVVARGGDTIEVRADVVFVNGQALPQTKLDEPCPPPPPGLGSGSPDCVILEERNGERRYRIQHDSRPASFGPRTVPPGHLFVMGDNRHNSNDSRVWGTVPVDLVKARAQFVWWSRLGSEVRWGRIGKVID